MRSVATYCDLENCSKTVCTLYIFCSKGFVRSLPLLSQCGWDGKNQEEPKEGPCAPSAQVSFTEA